MKQLDLVVKTAIARTAEAARLRAERNSAVQLARAYAARMRAAYAGEGWTAALIYGHLPGAVTLGADGEIASVLCEDPNIAVFENILVVEEK